MATQILAIETTVFNQQVQTLAKSDAKKETGPMGHAVSDLAHTKNQARKELNSAIIESTVNLSLTESPQGLVLKAALEGINEALQESLGDNAIQNAYDAGLDVSPEATADRIVSLSTAFLPQYQQQHPELSDDEARIAFTEIISGGVETGFSEAREILSGLAVLNGDVASNIDETYDLIQEKLAAFMESPE